MKKYELIIILLLSAVIIAVVHFIAVSVEGNPDNKTVEPVIAGYADPEPVRYDEYGIPVDSFMIVDGRVTRNQTLGGILAAFNVSGTKVHEIATYSRDIFDVRRIRPGDSYKLFITADTTGDARYLVYEPNPIDFIKVRLYDDIHIERGSREVRQVLKEVSGTINSSLWNAMTEKQAPPVLSIELSEIYAWTIDFFGLRSGDSFRAFYYENYIDTIPVGVDRIISAWFSHMGREFYAIPFEQDSVFSFFDQDGNSLRRAFLKAPLRYSRISSGFSHSRMHPILRVRRPHHGVDYAAPIGTPVYAIGDGRVTETSYSAGAGRMVRIRHNSVYSSAYLHLRNFAEGIRPDVWVNQGDLIGYVGSSGMSTGPHLDFRIWKNGQPVDPLSIESPPVEPVKEENLEAFNRIRDMWIERLNSL